MLERRDSEAVSPAEEDRDRRRVSMTGQRVGKALPAEMRFLLRPEGCTDLTREETITREEEEGLGRVCERPDAGKQG